MLSQIEQPAAEDVGNLGDHVDCGLVADPMDSEPIQQDLHPVDDIIGGGVLPIPFSAGGCDDDHQHVRSLSIGAVDDFVDFELMDSEPAPAGGVSPYQAPPPPAPQPAGDVCYGGDDIVIPEDIRGYCEAALTENSSSESVRRYADRVLNKTLGFPCDLYVRMTHEFFNSVFGPGSLDCFGSEAESDFIEIVQKHAMNGSLFRTDDEGNRWTVSGHDEQLKMSHSEAAVLAWKTKWGVSRAALDEINEISNFCHGQKLFNGDSERLTRKLNKEFDNAKDGHFWSVNLPWPAHWQMGSQRAIVLRGPFILKVIAELFSDPLIWFKWKEHAVLEARVANDGLERIVSQPMEGMFYLFI
jgi:hypothetical protein